MYLIGFGWYKTWFPNLHIWIWDLDLVSSLSMSDVMFGPDDDQKHSFHGTFVLEQVSKYTIENYKDSMVSSPLINPIGCFGFY